MAPSCNKEKLFEFLDFLSNKNVMVKSTVSSYRVACKNVLDVVGDDTDLSKVDLNSVFHQYESSNSMNVKADTMKEYRRRVTYILKEFLAHEENPAAWSPSSQQKSNQQHGKRRQTASQSSTQEQQSSGLEAEGVSTGHTAGADLDSVQKITHLFPMRENVVVSITGIPFDVKKAEMARLNAWLSNLVVEEDNKPPTPMLPPPSYEEE
jgi:hypothetical protein